MLVVFVSAFAAWPTTQPSYPHYPGRAVQSLTGTWDFGFSATYNLTTTTSLGSLSFNGTQQVPGAWDAGWTDLRHRRGVGAYRTRVPVPVHRASMLHFAACSLTCRVYVDGQLLHNHTLGGFTPFWVAVPPSTSIKERELIVITSNNFSKTLTPTQYEYYDFYQYGGLIRPVSWHVLPAQGPSLDRVEVAPLADTSGAVPSGAVNVTVVLRPPPGGGAGAQASAIMPGRVRLGLSWGLQRDGQSSTAAPMWDEYAVRSDGRVLLPSLNVPSYALWQPPENPSTVPSLPLHTLTVSLGEQKEPLADTAARAAEALPEAAVEDGITVRFGLRVVSTSGRQIRLNGRPLTLKGFNRHDMYPGVGPVLSRSQYEADLSQVQIDLHANFIRGSHYPQDSRLLDLCDERGILVWNEALAWGNWGVVLTDPTFMAAQLGTVHAMLDEAFNHPSIVLWGFFNEGQSDNDAAVVSYARMADTFRSRDRTRLVTWADNRMERSKALEHADVVSFNNYPGWYNGPASAIRAAWSAHAAWVAEHWPHKPFLISETGAGGIVGNHSHNQTSPSRWSEEYEVVVDGLDAETAMSCANISGIALWQLMDIKVDAANSSTNRPGGINNKGVLSRWRQPKLAAAKVAAVFAAADALPRAIECMEDEQCKELLGVLTDDQGSAVGGEAGSARLVQAGLLPAAMLKPGAMHGVVRP